MPVELTIGPDKAERAAMCRRAHAHAIGRSVDPTDAFRVYDDLTLLNETVHTAELLLRALAARIEELEVAQEASSPDPDDANPRQVPLKLCSPPGDHSA